MKLVELLLTLSLLNAQSRQKFCVGVTNGFGQAWLTNTGYNHTFKPSYNIGLTFESSKEVHWGLGGDIKYSMEGVRYHNTTTGQDRRYDLSYIRAPFRMHLYLNRYSKTFRPKIGVGPSIGYLIGTGQHTLNLERFQEQDETSRNFNKLDVGFQCMTGLNIHIAEDVWLNTDITYYQGLLEIDGSHIKNRNLGLNLGVLVKIK